MNRPLPDPAHPEFATYWAGTREGKLLVQRCAACGVRRWPPRAVCAVCLDDGVEWTDVAGEPAVLYSWTVVWHPTVPGLEPPYAVGVVEIGGVRMLGGVVGADFDALRVGMRVEPRVETVTPEITLVNWAPHPTEGEE